jgi:hypothetical protein
MLLAFAFASAAAADTADNSAGRFTMSPVDGGFLRLDKQTGAVAMCARTGTTWGCTPVEDHTPAAAAMELSKLEQENKDLKDRIKALEETLETKPPLNGPPGGKVQLPTDQEVDQALDYLERVYKKVRDRMKDLHKPLPPEDAAPPPKGSL